MNSTQLMLADVVHDAAIAPADKAALLTRIKQGIDLALVNDIADAIQAPLNRFFHKMDIQIDPTDPRLDQAAAKARQTIARAQQHFSSNIRHIEQDCADLETDLEQALPIT